MTAVDVITISSGDEKTELTMGLQQLGHADWPSHPAPVSANARPLSTLFRMVRLANAEITQRYDDVGWQGQGALHKRRSRTIGDTRLTHEFFTDPDKPQLKKDESWRHLP